MHGVANATTILDVIKALVEHKYAPVMLGLLLAFVAALVHTYISAKIKYSKLLYKKNENLIRKLRSDAQIARAETRRLAVRLEKCTDELNKLDGKYEVVKQELEECTPKK